MSTLLLVILILLLVGAFPTSGYGVGYGAHGLIGVLLIVILVLALTGRL